MNISIKLPLSLALAIPIFASGCKKPEAPVSSAITTNSTPGAATQAPPNPAMQAAVPGVAPGETVNLDREVRKWILRNRRPPSSFEEFASSAGVDIPPAPAGKKYVLDKTMHVKTANR